MARQNLLSLKEIEDFIHSSYHFASDDEDDKNGLIDVMELPPEQVDAVSDNEDIGDSIIDDEEPS